MRPTIGSMARAVAAAVRSSSRRRPSSPRPERSAQGRRRYPGDFTGSFTPRYAAKLDGRADPGEILWTWVPYEDDFTQGKDRPVLAVGEAKGWLLCLMLSSKDHDRDAADEARWGRRWMDVGAGPWDKKRRPSEVRLDRIIRIHPDDVRREGAVLDRKTFDKVIGSL
ncbi:type II toxin-antitoxin system PemK/MazF family toxin [Demequina sp.]|uniref:type II toxin-antitoxin system PemK/MazF family toxin n=1 Tax=Demequina sp. TaxID=2050685 RepID=UPI0025BDFE91|nr:type II toxin-antitoxin system PemK/MazF family toxin [Demequina sp.]